MEASDLISVSASLNAAVVSDAPPTLERSRSSIATPRVSGSYASSNRRWLGVSASVPLYCVLTAVMLSSRIASVTVILCFCARE